MKFAFFAVLAYACGSYVKTVFTLAFSVTLTPMMRYGPDNARGALCAWEYEKVDENKTLLW